MAKRFPINVSPFVQNLFINSLKRCFAWLIHRESHTRQQLISFYTFLKELWLNGTSGLQKAYLLCLLMIYPSGLEVVFVPLAILVITIDFWPKLVNLWDSHSGKLIIIFGYAVAMNFVLASASSLVNDVSGVSASYLPYTHNVAAILLMPEWVLSFGLLILVSIQFWLMMSVIYHLFKRDNYANYDNQGKVVRFPFLTALVKTVVVTFLSTQIGNTNNAEIFYPDKYNTTSKGISVNQSNNDSKFVANGKPNLSQIEFFFRENEFNFRELQEALLLAFMYYYETDTRSRCQLDDSERVVELNSREILVMKALDDSYDITITTCYSPVFPLKSD